MRGTWRLAVLAMCLAACGDDDGAGGDGASGSDAASAADAAGATDAAGPAPDAGPCEAGVLARRRVSVGAVHLSVAVQGCEGAPIVLLHGFPEPAASWEGVMAALSDEHRVIAPDQRGYDLSNVPPGVSDYTVDKLVADLDGLLDAMAAGEPVVLVAHDWGGIVAWTYAAEHPERLAGLVIVNSPHPDVFAGLLANDADQQQASQYMNLFISDSAEAILSANDYGLLLSGFGDALTPEQEDRYRQAWTRSGLTGMLSWYRANIDDGPTPGATFPTGVHVTVPTLVLWGMMDTALLPQNLDGLDAWVDDLEVQQFADATHWIVHEDQDGVVASIRAFAAAHE